LQLGIRNEAKAEERIKPHTEGTETRSFFMFTEGELRSQDRAQRRGRRGRKSSEGSRWDIRDEEEGRRNWEGRLT
jgi:hypothetical protein